jgi:hypothetical protein
MGVIIKYQVSFPDAGLTVSNDVFSGDFTLDASIQADMLRGALGGRLEVKLFNLPQAKVELLDKGVTAKTPKKIVIKLGYFDGDFSTVMQGVYSEVRSTVVEDQLVSIFKGNEDATAALASAKVTRGWAAEVPLQTIVTDLLASATLTVGKVDKTPKLEGRANDAAKKLKVPQVANETLLQTLDVMASRFQTEFAVFDQRMHFGTPVTDPGAPWSLTPDVNLAVFEPFIDAVPAADSENRLHPVTSELANGFHFMATGDPSVRPGRAVKPKVEKGDWESIPYRVLSVTHRFGLTSGYVCDGIALKVCTDDTCWKRQQLGGRRTADAVARDMSSLMKGAARGAAVDVGKVESYKAGSGTAPDVHRASLYTGQVFPTTETQPSLRTDVDAVADKIASNRPIVSPFAWHKCGLVVPVYAGMKAVMMHNLALTDDALVGGFMWSETPAIEPPPSNAGDWWLCLPIGIQSGATPTTSTKAANDLISAGGRRVIEARALTIKVGDKMTTIGTRPADGTDDELVIDHKSGSKVKIDANGDLTIEAKKITVTGDVTVDGKVTIKKDLTVDGSVTIS